MGVQGEPGLKGYQVSNPFERCLTLLAHTRIKGVIANFGVQKFAMTLTQILALQQALLICNLSTYLRGLLDAIGRHFRLCW